MRVSQFEIYRLCQRALEGLGAPYGVDQDGARTVAWLEARGLPGLALLAAGLPRLEGGFGGLALAPGEVIDAGGRPAVAYGSAVIDLLAAPAAKGATLHLRRCRAPLFLLPPAVAAAAGDLAVELGWNSVRCRVAPAGRVDLTPSPGPALEALLRDGGETEVTASAWRAEPRSHADGATEAVFAEWLRRSLDHGVAVDAATWAAIAEIAARVQVPASAESRLKGAGGGDANA
jgi:hypothetical protein